MTKIEIGQVSNDVQEFIEKLPHGETVVLTRGDKQLATIILPPEASADAKPRRQFGSAKGQFTMSADFDDPLEDFDEYMH